MKPSILYINACVRPQSRTARLAEALLERLGGPRQELRLAEIDFPTVDGAWLEKRDGLLARGRLDDPMFDLARQFAAAEIIVIAAPYWDLSFPAMLKQYLERVNVVGITFKYNEEGVPVGLCRGRRIYYVATAGGTWAPEEYGFGYVRALARGYYGIQDVRKLEALGLDIVGADAEAILRQAEAGIPALV